jgi:hypothetical protein
MIAELVNLLANFPGEPNQTQCFLHIINLVAKSVIRQFDVTKGKVDVALNKAEQALHVLAEGIDLENLETQGEQDDDGDGEDDDNGWVDERKTLSMADCEALDASIHPVKLVLVKVNSRVFVSNILTHLISTAAQNHILHYTLLDAVVAYMVRGT